MASFLRGKQAGIQGDLSHGILPETIKLDDVSENLLWTAADRCVPTPYHLPATLQNTLRTHIADTLDVLSISP